MNNKQLPLPPGLRDPLRFSDTNLVLQESVIEAFRQQPVQSYGDHTLEFSDFSYPKKRDFTLKEQKEALLSRASLGIPLRGTVTLRNKETGAVVSKKRTTVMRTPVITKRGTYVLGGSEYTLALQKRLRPGAYTRQTANKEYETFIKTKGGTGFNITMNPTSGELAFKIYNSKTPMYTVMRGLGMNDEEIKETMGEDLFKINRRSKYKNSLPKVWNKVTRGRKETDNIERDLLAEFENMELDENTTFKTLGTPYKNVSKDVFKDSVRNLLATYRGERDVDDRDAYSFQRILGPEDIFSEGILRDKAGVARNILYKAQHTKNLDHVNANIFKNIPDHVFHGSRLAQCFDCETKVLTERGFIPWPEVLEDDKFACDVDGVLEFHEAISQFKSHYTGEMVGCRSKRTDYLVTPNHRMWTKFQQRLNKKGIKNQYFIETAEDSFGKCRIHKTSLPKIIVSDPDQFKFTYLKGRWEHPTEVSIDYLDWMQFLGWWVSEGSAWDSPDKNGHSYRVTIAQNAEVHPEECLEIEAMLDRMPFHWRRGSNKNDYVINHKGLSLLLQSYGTKKDKSVPDYVRHSSTEALGAFFDAFMKGDGNEYNGFLKAQVVSEKLAEDLIEIWSSLTGGTAQISSQDRSHDGWSTYYTTSFSDTDHRGVSKRNYYKEQYDGMVYCAEVPGNKLFVLRGGKPLWTLNSIEEINPVDAIDGNVKITGMGDGGFGSDHGVPDSARMVSPTQLGYVDVVRTPESGSVGIDSRLAINTFKGADGNLYSQFIGKDGEPEYVSSSRLDDLVIAFPGDIKKVIDGKQPKVRAVNKGIIDYVDPSEVDYTLPAGQEMFSLSTNLIPYVSGVKGMRAMMGAKYVSQALSLQKREAPRVQSLAEDGQSFHRIAAEKVGAVWSKSSGQVLDVTKDSMKVQYDDGSVEDMELYNDFPMNRKSLLRQTSLLKPGERFEKNQPIIDSNYTAGGELALGTHLRVAYMDMKGMSVSKDSYVYWVDQSGDGHYTTIDKIDASEGVRALGVDQGNWDVKLDHVHNIWGHPTDDDMVLVTTRDGVKVKATENHSFITTDEEGVLHKVCPKDLIPGKSLVPVVKPVLNLRPELTELKLEIPNPSATKLSIPVDYDLGWFLGLFVAEGSAGKKAIQIAMTEPEIIDKCTSILKSWGINSRYQCRTQKGAGSKGQDIYAGCLSATCTVLAHYLKEHGGYLATGKKVPGIVLSSNLDVARGFIDGYWCGDGTVTKEVTASTRSEELANGVCFLLGALGVRATHREYKQKHYEKHEFRIKVFSFNLDKFPDLTLSRKQRGLASLREKSRSISRDRVPVPKTERFSIAKLFNLDSMSKSYVSRDRLLPIYDHLSERMQSIVDAPLWWDVVESVTTIDPEDIVYDVDMRPYGTFVVNTGLAVFNSHEDAGLISESAAKKLSSEHLYTKKLDLDSSTSTDLGKFMSIFSGKYTKDQLSNLSNEGVVKIGSVVKKDDPVVINMKKRSHKGLGMVSSGSKSSQWKDNTLTWDHTHDGIVTDVWHDRSGVKVAIKSIASMNQGDKLCFVEDHDLYTTNRGWQPVAEIEESDTMICLDLSKLTLEESKVAKANGYRHNGPIFSIDRPEVSMRVTLKHKLVASWDGAHFGLYPAEELLKSEIFWVLAGANMEPILISVEDDVVVEDYDGWVYCPTLEEHHTLLTRHNGLVHWSGNSGTFGNKTVISTILPDDQMPIGEDGQPLEYLVNPFGTIGRHNPSQIVEAQLAKVARHTGKNYVLPAFSDGEAMDMVQEELDKAGLKATESITLPEGRVVNNVMTGDGYYLKLHHMACFDDKTEVLTKDGWKLWVDVVDSDLLASIDGDTLVFEEPLSLYRNDYIGPMYGFEGRFIDYQVTPNHRMYCNKTFNKKFKFRTAEKVHGSRFGVPQFGFIPDSGVEDRSTLPIDCDWGDFCELSGWWLTEGCVTKTATQTVIYQSQKANPIKVARIEALLNRMGLKWVYHNSGGEVMGFRIKSKPLSRYYSSCGKWCQVKKIPRELIDGPVRGRERLIEAMMLGDGTEYDTNTGTKKCYYTTSNDLANGFQELCIRSGIGCVKHVTGPVEKRRYGTPSASYRCSIQSRTIAQVDGDRNKDGFSITDYNGIVYCATMRTGLLYVRRNGKPMVSGNSDKRSEVGEGAFNLGSVPTSGPDEDKPKRVGSLEMEAILAHGAPAVVRDAKLIRGQENREYFKDLMDGKNPKMPKVSPVYRRFIATLQSAGIRITPTDDNTSLKLSAMTDKDVLAKSNGEITEGATIKWKSRYGKNLRGEADMNPVENGLFDRGITGGMGGTNFSHISLPTKLPQPVFEKQIRAILGITEEQLHQIIMGQHPIGDFGSGPQGLERALSSFNVDKKIEELSALYKGATKPSVKDKLAKQLRAFKGLRGQGIHPKDLLTSKALVIPPIFRPVSVTSDFEIIADANLLYKDLLDAKKNYLDLEGVVGEEMRSEGLLSVYKAYKAVTGLGQPIKRDRVEKKIKGLLSDVFGPNGNKTSLVQRNLTGTPTAYSARGVIVPDPTLTLDEVGLPWDQAWTLFSPFVIKRLIAGTDGSFTAKKKVMKDIENRSDNAKQALLTEMKERPVMYSRAPALHKYSVLAGFGVPVTGNAIRTNIPTMVGLGADFDGDTLQVHAIVTPDAVKEAKEKMLPSKHLFSVSDFKLMHTPEHGFNMGIYNLGGTPGKRGKLISTRSFKNKEELMAAYSRGDISLEDEVVIEDEQES